MKSDRELMQQALVFIEEMSGGYGGGLIEALRARLAQPEPEPVAWLCKNKKSGGLFALTREQLHELGYGNIAMPAFEKVAPLYSGYKPPKKLWLWKNFVDNKPEYWAFDNPYPTNLDGGDPQTLGQPCGYAIFKLSRDGSNGRTEEQVLREMKSVTASPQPNEFNPDWEAMAVMVEEQQRMAKRIEELEVLCNLQTQRAHDYAEAFMRSKREWQGLTDEERDEICLGDEAIARAIEAKLKEKNT